MEHHPARTHLKVIKSISALLDTQFRFPGTKFRFGLDPILGFLPVVGDLSSLFMSMALLGIARRHGASKKVVIKMSINMLIDLVFGSIPIIGNIFDFFFKANKKNLRLLTEHYEEGKHHGSGRGILIIVVLVLIAGFAAVIFGFYKLYQLIISYF